LYKEISDIRTIYPDFQKVSRVQGQGHELKAPDNDIPETSVYIKTATYSPRMKGVRL
jgi:hypothetical protein